jgi:hypothetical protein
LGRSIRGVQCGCFSRGFDCLFFDTSKELRTAGNIMDEANDLAGSPYLKTEERGEDETRS